MLMLLLLLVVIRSYITVAALAQHPIGITAIIVTQQLQLYLVQLPLNDSLSIVLCHLFIAVY